MSSNDVLDAVHAKVAEIMANRKPERIIDLRNTARPSPPLTAVLPFNPPARRLPRVGDADWVGLTNAEKLHALTEEALSVQRELLALGVDPDDHKRNSMLKDVAQGIVNAQIKVEETTLRQKCNDDVMEIISKRIAEAEVRLGREPGMLPPESD